MAATQESLESNKYRSHPERTTFFEKATIWHTLDYVGICTLCRYSRYDSGTIYGSDDSIGTGTNRMT